MFPTARVAVFLDGCFWHGCPEHHTVAVTNGHFWADKIRTNRLRDQDTDRRLNEAGWLSVRVWEHEDPARAALMIREVVENTAESVSVWSDGSGRGHAVSQYRQT